MRYDSVRSDGVRWGGIGCDCACTHPTTYPPPLYFPPLHPLRPLPPAPPAPPRRWLRTAAPAPLRCVPPSERAVPAPPWTRHRSAPPRSEPASAWARRCAYDVLCAVKHGRQCQLYCAVLGAGRRSGGRGRTDTRCLRRPDQPRPAPTSPVRAPEVPRPGALPPPATAPALISGSGIQSTSSASPVSCSIS